MSAGCSRPRRDILCAAMIATFAVTTGTGILMFFHLAQGSVVVVHEWIGLAFLGLACWHMVRNWPGLRAYCRRPLFVGSIFLALAIGIAITVLTPSEPRGRGHRADPAEPPTTTITEVAAAEQAGIASPMAQAC